MDIHLSFLLIFYPVSLSSNHSFIHPTMDIHSSNHGYSFIQSCNLQFLSHPTIHSFIEHGCLFIQSCNLQFLSHPTIHSFFEHGCLSIQSCHLKFLSHPTIHSFIQTWIFIHPFFSSFTQFICHPTIHSFNFNFFFTHSVFCHLSIYLTSRSFISSLLVFVIKEKGAGLLLDTLWPLMNQV